MSKFQVNILIIIFLIISSKELNKIISMNKKSLIITSILAGSMLLSTGIANAYSEIECSTDAIFAQYECNQCFD